MSTLFVLSAAIALLAISSPLLLSHFLQPAQAQSSLSFRTTEPASGGVQCSNTGVMLTFDAQGTPSSSNPQRVDITGGTFQMSDIRGGQILYSGNITSGRFSNSSGGGGSLLIITTVNHAPNGTSACASKGDTLTMDTACSTNENNPILVGFEGGGVDSFGDFNGAVECSQGGGNSTTQSSSSPGTTTTQDSDCDGDGIPDSSDNCTHNSNPRCFKEEDIGTTTQQLSSAINRMGG